VPEKGVSWPMEVPVDNCERPNPPLLVKRGLYRKEKIESGKHRNQIPETKGKPLPEIFQKEKEKTEGRYKVQKKLGTERGAKRLLI